MIYHIYWGTAGNAGLYLDEIYQVLNKVGYKQKVFVSYYYPFDYGEKVFFKRTEMEHCRYKGLVRKVLQAYEFVVALFKILLQVFKDKPNVINYSYVNRGNALLFYFLKCIERISHCKLVITCHDVIPIIEERKAYNKEITIKKRIFSLADYYLVHTEASKNELKSIFGVREEQVLMHLFPLMDLSKMDKGGEVVNTKYDFLFIGHMRPEKGIPLLVDAWNTFHKSNPEARLCIAGNPNYYKQYLAEREEWCAKNGIDLKLGFISDEDYIRIVKSSRCVVFPYTGGTNSGVISTVVSLGRDVITSDLGMFANNPFVPKENMFRTGSVESLIETLKDYQLGKLVSDSLLRIEKYRLVFGEQVRSAYAIANH